MRRQLFTSFLLYFAILSSAPTQEKSSAPIRDDSEEVVQRILDDIKSRDASVAAKTWTYARLSQSADTVVVGVFAKRESISFGEDDAQSVKDYKDRIVAFESRFTVLGAIRPDKNWEQTPATIDILHFGWKEPGIRTGSAPHFVDFSRPFFERESILVIGPDEIRRLPTDTLRRTERKFLMFLKARSDGRYEPVTGQHFPGLALRCLSDVESF